MANVQGVRTTGNIQQSRRIVDMAKNIYLLDPNIAPFITILKRVKNGSNIRVVESPEFKWLEDDYNGTTTQVATAIAAAATTTLVVDDGSIFRAGDIINIPSVGENMLVTAVSTNSLTVVRGYGSTAASASIAVDADVIIIGSAMPENANARARLSTQEVVRTNYTQIFRTPIELSRTEEKSALYGGADRNYQRRKALAEHKRDIARAMYFGQAKEDLTGSTPRRTMGGMIEFIKNGGNVQAFSAGGTVLTYANFNTNVARKAFEHGSDEKLLVCGGILASAIDHWDLANVKTDVGSDKTFGVHVTKLVTSYGVMNVVYDPLLAGSIYGGYGLVLDMENIRYAHLRDSDTKLKTNIQAPDQDGVMDEYLTECSLELKLPKTHMLITGAYDA